MRNNNKKTLKAIIKDPTGIEVNLNEEEKTRFKWEWLYSLTGSEIYKDILTGSNQCYFYVKTFEEHCNAILKVTYPKFTISDT